MEEINIYKIGFNGDKARLILPDGYEFKAEGNKVFVIKKKSKYPKTYVECAKILNCFSALHIDGYKNELFGKLQELYICRNAYWKIAGEEMGLGKPWEPDWSSFSEETYPTITKCNGRIIKTSIYTNDSFLAFPTAEIRDAFYENFKDLIEECKELL